MKRIITLLLVIYTYTLSAQTCIPNSSCLHFDGISTYVDLPTNNNLDITDTISIEAWIKASAWASTPASGTIVCKHGWSTSEVGFVFRAGGSGQLSFNIACDTNGTNISWKEVVSNTGALSLNTWYHVAATFDGYDMKLYINGALAKTFSLGFHGAIVSSPHKMKIGRLSDSVQAQTRLWTGDMDEVRIWHRVLNQSEIAANMNNHIDYSTAADLVGYFRMNEDTGTTVADLGTGNNTGTIIGGTWSHNVPFVSSVAVPVITQAGTQLNSNTPIGNQWYLDTVAIPGATLSHYTPTQIGSYTVVVTGGNGCTASSAPFIITTLGLESPSSNEFAKILNPKKGVLLISMDENLIRNTEMKIYDINGRTLMSFGKGELQEETNIQSLSSGVYIILLKAEKKSIKQKLILN